MYVHVLKDEFKYTHQLKLLTSDKFNVINSSNKATAGQLIIDTMVIFYRLFLILFFTFSQILFALPFIIALRNDTAIYRL